MAIIRFYTDFDYANLDLGLLLGTNAKVEYICDIGTSREQIISDPLFHGTYGNDVSAFAGRPLYVHKCVLEYSGRDANVATWYADLTLSTEQPQRAAQLDNPLMRPVRRLKWESENQMVLALMDHNGRAACNMAGDYFGGFEKEARIKKMKFAMNYAAVPDWAFFNDGCVSSTDMTILGVLMPAGSIKLFIPEGPLEPTVENGYSYYQLNYELHFNPMGWQSLYANMGMQQLLYLDSSGNKVSPNATPGAGPGQWYDTKKVAILDDKGEPVKKDVFLDSYGRYLPEKHVRPATTLAGTASATRGLPEITPAFSTSEDDVGLCIGLKVAGSTFPYIFVTEIVGRSGSELTLKDAPPWTATVSVFVPGISAISLANSPYCDLVALGIPY